MHCKRWLGRGARTNSAVIQVLWHTRYSSNYKNSAKPRAECPQGTRAFKITHLQRTWRSFQAQVAQEKLVTSCGAHRRLCKEATCRHGLLWSKAYSTKAWRRKRGEHWS